MCLLVYIYCWLCKIYVLMCSHFALHSWYRVWKGTHLVSIILSISIIQTKFPFNDGELQQMWYKSDMFDYSSSWRDCQAETHRTYCSHCGPHSSSGTTTPQVLMSLFREMPLWLNVKVLWFPKMYQNECLTARPFSLLWHFAAYALCALRAHSVFLCQTCKVWDKICLFCWKAAWVFIKLAKLSQCLLAQKHCDALRAVGIWTHILQQ